MGEGSCRCGFEAVLHLGLLLIPFPNKKEGVCL